MGNQHMVIAAKSEVDALVPMIRKLNVFLGTRSRLGQTGINLLRWELNTYARRLERTEKALARAYRMEEV